MYVLLLSTYSESGLISESGSSTLHTELISSSRQDSDPVDLREDAVLQKVRDARAVFHQASVILLVYLVIFFICWLPLFVTTALVSTKAPTCFFFLSFLTRLLCPIFEMFHTFAYFHLPLKWIGLSGTMLPTLCRLFFMVLFPSLSDSFRMSLRVYKLRHVIVHLFSLFSSSLYLYVFILSSLLFLSSHNRLSFESHHKISLCLSAYLFVFAFISLPLPLPLLSVSIHLLSPQGFLNAIVYNYQLCIRNLPSNIFCCISGLKPEVSNLDPM